MLKHSSSPKTGQHIRIEVQNFVIKILPLRCSRLLCRIWIILTFVLFGAALDNTPPPLPPPTPPSTISLRALRLTRVFVFQISRPLVLDIVSKHFSIFLIDQIYIHEYLLYLSIDLPFHLLSCFHLFFSFSCFLSASVPVHLCACLFRSKYLYV